MKYGILYTTKTDFCSAIEYLHREYNYFDSEKERAEWIANELSKHKGWRVMKLFDTAEQDAIIEAFKSKPTLASGTIDGEGSIAMGKTVYHI